MAADLFQLLVILSVAILVLSFIRCFLAHDRGHVIYMNRDSSLKRPPGSPILTEIYYGALDGDSEEFIMKQLLPTYEKAADIMDIVLVPFGKTQMSKTPSGTYHFECAQGPTECEANLLHACIVDEVQDVQLQLNWITCMWGHMNNLRPLEAFIKCYPDEHFSKTAVIQECVNGDRGMELLKQNGEQTKASSKRRVDVPFVILNGSRLSRPKTVLAKKSFRGVTSQQWDRWWSSKRTRFSHIDQAIFDLISMKQSVKGVCGSNISGAPLSDNADLQSINENMDPNCTDNNIVFDLTPSPAPSSTRK